MNNKFTKSPLNVPKLRFKGFEGKWEEKKLLNVCEKNNNSKISSNYFLDAPAIMNKKYSKYNKEKFKQGFEDSIIFIKDGSNSGEFFYSHYDSKIATTCEQIYTNQHNNFIFYMLDKNKTNIKKKLLIGETIPHLYKKNLVNLSFYFPSIQEQQKIAKFFSLLDKQIELWNTKLQLSEQLRKYLLFLSFFNKKKLNKIKLQDILIESKEFIHHKLIELGVVGKNGIRLKKDVFKSNLLVKENHRCKILHKNELVIGIGSNQIDSYINLNYDSLGVSVAYKIYKINHSISPFYLNLLLQIKNKILSKKFMIISSRQGKTVDVANLFQYDFFIHNFKGQKTIEMQMNIFNKLLENIKQKIIFLEKIKNKYLKEIFI